MSGAVPEGEPLVPYHGASGSLHLRYYINVHLLSYVIKYKYFDISIYY